MPVEVLLFPIDSFAYTFFRSFFLFFSFSFFFPSTVAVTLAYIERQNMK